MLVTWLQLRIQGHMLCILPCKDLRSWLWNLMRISNTKAWVVILGQRHPCNG